MKDSAYAWLSTADAQSQDGIESVRREAAHLSAWPVYSPRSYRSLWVILCFQPIPVRERPKVAVVPTFNRLSPACSPSERDAEEQAGLSVLHHVAAKGV